MTTPATPHAILTIDRPGLADGQSSVRYDNWEMKGLFKSVDVELVVDESSQATIAFFDKDYRLIDSFSDYAEKAVMKVYLGYGTDLGQPVFKGLLADITRRRGETIFTAYDMGYSMKLVKRTGFKNKKNDIDIIRECVQRQEGKPLTAVYPLKFDPPRDPKKLPPEPHNSMPQDGQTDWDHMMERARAAGLHIFVRHDTVFARYPSDYSKAPAFTLVPPKEPKLLDGWQFRYHTLISRDAKSKSVAHRARGKAGKREEGKAETHMRAEVSHIQIKQDTQAPSKSKLDARAKAQRELEREHAFEGSIETIFPSTSVRPDVLDVIPVEGIGKLLSGKYIADSVRYRLGPGEFSMGMELYRDILEA